MKEKIITIRFIVGITLGLLVFFPLFYLERFMAMGGPLGLMAMSGNYLGGRSSDLQVPFNYSYEIIIFLISMLIVFIVSGSNLKKRILGVLITLISILLILSLTILL